MVFFSSDRADLNSILNADIIAKFKELCNWVVFICVSHRLELALQDALKSWFESVETCVRNLYYLYQKSTRHFMKFCLKCTNLVKIAHSLTVHQEHPGLITRWKPWRECWTNWCLYGTYWRRVARWEVKKNDKATLQGKRGKLLEATTTSCAALFLDIL